MWLDDINFDGNLFGGLDGVGFVEHLALYC
jgi:hypothetical protein